MKVKCLLVILVGIFLSSCVTQKEFETKLASWIGQPERQLINSWGPPNRVYESGDSKYLTWTTSGSVTIPGSSPTYYTNVIGSTAYTTAVGGSAPTTINTNCETPSFA